MSTSSHRSTDQSATDAHEAAGTRQRLSSTKLGSGFLLIAALGCAACSSTSSPAASTDAGAAIEAASSPAQDATASDAQSLAEGSTPAVGDGSSNAEGSLASETGGRGTTCGSAVVCDDFEGYAIGAVPSAPWSVSKSVGSALVDGTRSRSGKQSVKITAPAATGYRSTLLRLTGGGLLPVTGSSVYGRMMFWLESTPTTSVHWTFIDGAGLVPSTTYHSVYRYGGQKPLAAPDGGVGGSQMMASYDTPDFYAGTGPGSDCYKHSSGRAVPVGAWTCAEWQFDGATNTMHFWINGAEAADLTVSGTGEGCTQQPSTYVWAAPTFEQLDVGWESYQADDARTMWIDDLAYGRARVGCPASN